MYAYYFFIRTSLFRSSRWWASRAMIRGQFENLQSTTVLTLFFDNQSARGNDVSRCRCVWPRLSQCETTDSSPQLDFFIFLYISCLLFCYSLLTFFFSFLVQSHKDPNLSCQNTHLISSLYTAPATGDSKSGSFADTRHIACATLITPASTIHDPMMPTASVTYSVTNVTPTNVITLALCLCGPLSGAIIIPCGCCMNSAKYSAARATIQKKATGCTNTPKHDSVMKHRA